MHIDKTKYFSDKIRIIKKHICRKNSKINIQFIILQIFKTYIVCICKFLTDAFAFMRTRKSFNYDKQLLILLMFY